MAALPNVHAISVPVNGLVIEPTCPLPEAIQRLYSRLERTTVDSQQSFELGGCEGTAPYTLALRQIDQAIGQLKTLRREMQQLSRHVHDWNEDQCCVICGWDGNA